MHRVKPDYALLLKTMALAAGVAAMTCTDGPDSMLCGDGIVQAGEECDDGDGADIAIGDYCTIDCSVLLDYCGNGRIEEGEECDDGNVSFLDGCSGDCRTEFTCGNGELEPGEECDDGNDDNSDAGVLHRGGCRNARCGDGWIWAGVEACYGDTLGL